MNNRPSGSSATLSRSRERTRFTHAEEHITTKTILLDDPEHAAHSEAKTSIKTEDVPPLRVSKPTRPPFWYPETWLYDCIALGSAAAVFVALIVVLAKYDKAPNPLWMAGITLNTIVSVVSVLFRIGIMFPVANCISQQCWVWYAGRQRPLRHVAAFDQASRGPVGGLYALFDGSWNLLALLGIFVTVVAMAVGPAFQQSVGFYTSSVVNEKLVAYTSTARGYNGTTFWDKDDYYNSVGDYITFNMKSAMYTGLLASGMGAAPNAPYSCPTGNCTWDPFPTLAVGMECIDTPNYYALNCSLQGEDVSEKMPGGCRIQRTSAFTDLTENQDTRGSTDARALFDINKLNYTLSEPPVLFLGTWFTNSDNLMPSTWSTNPTGGLLMMQWVRATNLRQSSGSYSFRYPQNTSRIESQSCIIYTAMQEISAKVQDGIYSEEVLRQETRPDNADALKNHGGPPCISCIRALNIEYTYKPSCEPPSVESHCDPSPLTVSLPLLRNAELLSGLDHLFSIEGQNYTDVLDTLESSQILKLLYGSGNITKAIESLTYYTTLALRSNDTTLAFQNDPKNATGLALDYVAPSHRVKGYAYVNQIHVAVTWYWLILPALLLVCATMLLACTIRATHVQDVGVWKDSALAVLAHSEWHDRPVSVGGSTATEIEKSVQGVRARLVGTRLWIGGDEVTSGDS